METEQSEVREPKVINRGESTLEAAEKLKRFLHVGNDRNVFISQRNLPISMNDIDTRLNFIPELIIEDFNLPFKIIKNVLNSNTLRRKDEAFFAIAYCLRRINNITDADIIKMQAVIYEGLPSLLENDSDLFLFVYLNNKIVNNPLVVANERTSFGRGIKKAISQWYNNRSAMELANIFGRNRGMLGWTHRDIIRLCHLKFDNNTDRGKVIGTMFHRGSETISEMNDQDPSWPEALDRIFQIFNLKVNESPTDAAELIKLHHFEVGHLPSHLISEPVIWEILIPKLKYRELLKIFPTLHTLNMLKATDEISKKFSMSIGNANLIKIDGIHPLEMLATKKLYDNNNRYNESVKCNWYEKKKIRKHKLTPNPYITKRLTLAVNHAINHCTQTGCEYIVTLDMRHSSKRHTVLRMSQVKCIEAMALFALLLKKREKNTKIYKFGDNRETLLPLKITSDMTFERALAFCQENTMLKTKQCLSLPLTYAGKNNKNTIFLTIVESVARFCRQGEAPIEQFRLHRKNNPHSKFIVLNLRRCHGDLQFTYEKGFLEICGLTPDTSKIINAFATNCFD